MDSSAGTESDVAVPGPCTGPPVANRDEPPPPLKPGSEYLTLMRAVRVRAARFRADSAPPVAADALMLDDRSRAVELIPDSALDVFALTSIVPVVPSAFRFAASVFEFAGLLLPSIVTVPSPRLIASIAARSA